MLQSLLTYIADAYVENLPLDEIPGMAWSSRALEKFKLAKTIPGRQTYRKMFAEDEELHDRDSTMGQILVGTSLTPVTSTS